MFKQRRPKIFSALTVVCLSLSSPWFLTRNSWAQPAPDLEIAVLTKQLKSQDVKQRLDALESLFKISYTYGGAKSEAVVPVMITALKDPDARVRQQSASDLRASLGKPGSNQSAQAAIPELIAALKDPKKDVRREATISLGMEGVPARLSIPALSGALRDRSKDVREQAAIALGYSDAQARGATPDDKDLLREQAVNALIRAATKDSSEDVRIVAVMSLENMRALTEDLYQKYHEVRCISFKKERAF